MHKLQHFMADDHRRCDLIFVEVERAVEMRDWPVASAVFERFQHAMLAHFLAEESVLFPAFEAKTGMSMGPTQVMRTEHGQMRELLTAAQESLVAQDADDYSGNAETLLIMLQQHNMKEENVLYPMCDQQLSAQADGVLTQLQDQLQAAQA